MKGSGVGGVKMTEKGHFLNDQGIYIIMNKETKFFGVFFVFGLHYEL